MQVKQQYTIQFGGTMREKVNQAAKGIFEYSSSALNITPEELSVKVKSIKG